MKPCFANLDNKRIGMVISVISIILLLMLSSFSFKIARAEAAACVHPGNVSCPVTAHIPPASYFGAALLAVIFILGIRLMRKAEAGEKIRKDAAEKVESVAKALKGNEKKAYELIAASQGAIFQSELVEKMGYSKMKVTRTLDKLEGQGLIERRRRGLANMVLIRYR